MFDKRPPSEKALARAATILGIALKDGKLRPKVAIHGVLASTATPIAAADATAHLEAASGRLVVQDSAGRRFTIEPKGDARWVDLFISALADYRASVAA